MQIKNIQISGFGKLKNVNIDFSNGINLIKGKNEAGKSTLADFIRVVLYGISKNKNGKVYSDYEKYLPWGNGDFSGKIEYELDGKTYSLRRDFSKNKVTIYDEFNNDITDEFSKSKSKGSNIGFDQLGIDEETFVNSTLVRQNQISVDSLSQNTIIQKLGNAIQTGDESLSYDEIQKKLDKILREEIGTERTTTKPKFLLKKDIYDLEIKKDRLELKRKRNETIREEQERIINEKVELDKELKDSKLIDEINEKYDKEIQDEKRLFDIEQEKKNEEKEKKERRRWINKTIDIVLISVMFISLIVTLIIKNHLILALITLPIAVAALLLDYKYSFKEEIEADTDNFDLITEDIKKKKKKELTAKEKLGVSKSITDMRTLDLKKHIIELEENIKSKELEYHKYEIEKDSLKENLGELNETIEDLAYKKEEYNKLLEKEEVMQIGIDKLKDAYDEIKKAIIPRLEEDIKYNISKTTGGKYKDIKYNDNTGILCQNEFGDLITRDKLRGGTTDQIYLGFRMAVADKYEHLPLIFDDTFVFFDEDRLENILKTISEMSEDKQIIILTCSDREEEELKKLKAKFTQIDI